MTNPAPDRDDAELLGRRRLLGSVCPRAYEESKNETGSR